MNELSTELVSLLYFVLPGFVAAWVFHSLTAHRRDTPFERLIHALIFTSLIIALISIIKWACLYIGVHWWSLGPWVDGADQVLAVIVAILLGTLFAIFSNHDSIHAFLRWLDVTRRTSMPSQWFSALSDQDNYVTLHLTNGRRIYGWPGEWPDYPDSGHFRVYQPEWLLDDGSRAPLYNTEWLLVPANLVEMVEHHKKPDPEVTENEIKSVEDRLVSLNRSSRNESDSGA